MGAGGTSGGVNKFILGLVLMALGIFLLFKNILVTNSFAFGAPLFGNYFGVAVPSGSLFLPLTIGIVGIFYNYKSVLSWVLSIGAISALVANVLFSLHVTLRPMSLLDIVVILFLIASGLGLFLKSFKPQ